MAAPRSRILDLIKLQCRLYSHTFNPRCTHTGNSILRQRLKGPSIAAYYPRLPVVLADLERLYPDLETYDERVSDRLEKMAIVKARGKGPPKKKRTREDSKKFGKKKSMAAPKAAIASKVPPK